MKKIIVIYSCLCLAIPVWSQLNPVELGDVHWFRDITKAQTESLASGKPIFILFQEIPGCITCQKYGAEVMKNPVIIQALENEFIPLAIYNNKKGEDARVLKYFNEPAWNNPVARIVDEKLNDLIPRLDGGYTTRAVTNYLIKSLLVSRRAVPAYLINDSN